VSDVTVEICRVESASDFDVLHALFVAYEADLPANLRHGTVPSAGELAKIYTGPNAAFVAAAGGEAIGCVGIRELDRSTGLMLRLYVMPNHRGSGTARALVAATIAHAKEQTYRRIVLDTNKEQLMPAYRLYSSLGFEECAPFGEVAYECPTFMALALEPVSRRSDSNR
jgi:ribosomal protein S18 acetylase RimI-like enzyme